MWSLCFLAAVDKKPRTLWACHCVTFKISASVDPWGRPISSNLGSLAFRPRPCRRAGRDGFGFLGSALFALASTVSGSRRFVPFGGTLLGSSQGLRGAFVRGRGGARWPRIGGGVASFGVGHLSLFLRAVGA